MILWHGLVQERSAPTGTEPSAAEELSGLRSAQWSPALGLGGGAGKRLHGAELGPQLHNADAGTGDSPLSLSVDCRGGWAE